MEAATTPARRRAPMLGRSTAALLAGGLLFTALVTWSAERAHINNEARLLEERAEEASAVLQATVPAITAKAVEAARLAALLQDDPDALAEELAVDVGEDGRFTSIIVERNGEALVAVGEPAQLSEDQRREATAATIGTEERGVHVTGLLDGPTPRLVYSAASPTHAEVVAHTEQPVAINAVEDEEWSSTSFDGIDVALYLGDAEDPSQLLSATSVDPALDGRRTTRSIPIGDQTMRFVVSPVGELGGGLLQALPWMTAGAGMASTAAAALLVEGLHRRRRDAEALSDELAQLYQRERTIASTLQHSLLPSHLGDLDGLEVAARYFAGAEGAEVGGDWYDVVDQDGRFTVVVGDVVGRGVQAAAVMAAMRYGTHAVAGQTSDPGEVLRAVNSLEHIRGDFVTMLCGWVDPVARSVRFASAGHPAPLLVSAEETRFLRVATGPPIGFLDEVSYPTKRAEVPAGSVLVLFTDGLFERRGEDIDVGLERLRAAAARLATRSVEEILDGLAAAMLDGGVHDDTAMLAFRVP